MERIRVDTVGFESLLIRIADISFPTGDINLAQYFSVSNAKHTTWFVRLNRSWHLVCSLSFSAARFWQPKDKSEKPVLGSECMSACECEPCTVLSPRIPFCFWYTGRLLKGPIDESALDMRRKRPPPVCVDFNKRTPRINSGCQ